MATLAEWVEGARPRTPAGGDRAGRRGSAVAWFEESFSALLAGLALVVALALQVGVNFANDYSDGIRGLTTGGPLRLVGSSGPPAARSRRRLRLLLGSRRGRGPSPSWSSPATGGWWRSASRRSPRPGTTPGDASRTATLGLGEVFVFIFFGSSPSAEPSTSSRCCSRRPWWTAIAIGALACAIRSRTTCDLDNDRASGKLTMATRLGDSGTRRFFVALLALAAIGVFGVAATSSWWALLGWFMLLALVGPIREVLRGVSGRALIPVLKQTGLAELACAAGLFVGLFIAH